MHTLKHIIYSGIEQDREKKRSFFENNETYFILTHRSSSDKQNTLRLTQKTQQDMKYTNHITTDFLQQDSKPVGGAVAKINNNLNNVVDIDTSQDLLKLVTQPNGYSWSPSVFEGKRNNDNWIGANVIALDFDDGTSIQDTLDMLDQDFLPNLYYYTFSSTQDYPKYRLVWLLDEFIDTRSKYKTMLKGLLELLDHADGSCKDFARFYYGGSQGDVIHDKEINAEHLFHYCDSIVISNTSKERMYRSNDTDYKETSTIDDDSEYANDLRQIKKRTVRESEWNKLKELDIIQQFMEGRKDFRHPDIFALATNLYWIKGGHQFMVKIMNKTNKQGKTDYTRNNFNAIRSAAKYKYFPRDLRETRFTDDIINIPLHLFNVRGRVEKVGDQPEKITLSEAEESLTDAISFDFDGKRVVKTPPGLGKTERVLDLIEDEPSTVLAFPTHDLKEEVSERLNEKGIDHKCTPRIPNFKSDLVKNRMERLFAVGLVKKAMSVVYDVADAKMGTMLDITAAGLYKDEMVEVHSYDGPILTTHTKAMHSNFKQNNMVFDEDPNELELEWSSIKIKDLFNLKADPQIAKLVNYELDFEEADVAESVKTVLTDICNMDAGQITETPDWHVDLEEFIDQILKNDFDSNIAHFLTSDFIRLDEDDPNQVEFVKRNTLPDNKNVLVLSASANGEIYEALYDDIEVVDITDVEHVGTIECNTSKSYSKTSINNSSEQELKELTDRPTITFNDAKDKVKNPVDEMHFFNTSGYDSLKGKDIAVVGTPHKPLSKYKMIAKVLDLDVDEDGLKTAYRTVRYNGFEFKFYTFKDKQLQQMHLQDIEGELLQAVGRARALREDCTVEVYSNFPLRCADKISW